MFHPQKLVLGLALALSGSSMAQEFEPRIDASRAAANPVLEGRATSLAQADFDGDGVPDLAVAYRLGESGAIAIFRGEYAALYPRFPAALARRAALGNQLQPFDPAPLWTQITTAAADFLVAGDFDADGHADLVWASRDRAFLHFAGGSGAGSFAASQTRALPDLPTALGAFELDRVDGLPEIVVGVDGDANRALLLFGGPRGAWAATPAIYPVTETIRRLSAGRIDPDPYIDLALNEGNERAVLLGADDEATPQMQRLEMPRAFLDHEAAFAKETVASLPMRLDDNGMTDFVKIDDSGKLVFERFVPANTFTVNSTDSVIDGTCNLAHCSLNDAIQAANTSPGSDAIVFNLPGSPPYRINSNGSHPVITETLMIDGSTQPGFAGDPIVELHGPGSGDGLIFGAAAISSLVRSLVINGFVSIPHYSYGIAISIGSPNTTVEGCRIGTSVDGQTAIANTGGIGFSFGADRGLVGGTAAGAGNLISGNTWFGVYDYQAVDTVIQGNRIGTRPAGTGSGLGNGTGVILGGTGSRLGGDSAGTGNLISGNSIGINDIGQLNAIQGNRIGTDLSGSNPLPNTLRGIWLAGTQLLIGGTTTTLASNIISGNLGNGIEGNASQTRIEANKIGVSATGFPLPNGGAGIALIGSRNRIGNAAAGLAAGNAIAFNEGGINCNFDTGATGMRILSNSIILNSAYNIFCGPPPPTLTAATLGTGGLFVNGSHHGEPNWDYRIEFFRSDSCGQGGIPGGYALLGFQDVHTDGAGNASYNFNLPAPPVDLLVGNVVTATANPFALDPQIGDSLNASGFSACQPVVATPGAPYLDIPDHLPATTDRPVTVPIYLHPGSHLIAGIAFSLDLPGCLGFDPVDADHNGTPDAITLHLPADWSSSISYDALDSDGELDFAFFDLPPLVAAPDGLVAEVRFSVFCPGGLPPTVVPMDFSTAPTPSFGNTLGQNVPGTFSNGSVDIFGGLRGDCNGDGFVNAADLVACGLEAFDGDGNFWLDVPGGSFHGNPVGCDANADTIVDAGDLSCKINLIFGRPCGSSSAAFGAAPQLLLGATESRAGELVAPILLDPGGQALTATIFSLDLPAGVSFDPADNNGDGLPDSVTMTYQGNLRSISYDPADSDGEIHVVLADLSPVPRLLPYGKLFEIRVNPGTVPPARALTFGATPSPSFGTAAGTSAPAALSTLFFDGFESGNFSAWSSHIP